MFKLLVNGLFVCSLVAQSDFKQLSYELGHITPKQQKVACMVFKKAKEFHLEYTMTAIAWEESKFGKYNVNLADPSFGVFHNQIDSVADRHGTKSKWGKSRLAEQLLYSFDFSFAEALAELKYWQTYYKNSWDWWRKMVMSYNAGHNLSNGKTYYKRIVLKIKVLRKLGLKCDNY